MNPSDFDAQAGQRPVIVTICGSMRFYRAMLDVAARLTERGVIVLMPHCVVEPDKQTSAMKAQLDRLHRHKIEMSDEIMVVTDETGYYGDSTRDEIGYALAHGKLINWSAGPTTSGEVPVVDPNLLRAVRGGAIAYVSPGRARFGRRAALDPSRLGGENR